MEKKLYRSRTDKTISGVCGGLGKLIGIDPTIVRVVFAVASFFSGGFPGLILYVILACIIPEEPMDGQPADQAWQPYQAWQPQQEPQQENPPVDAEPPAGDADAQN